jgi:acetyl-CoA carboxylase carboxyltransferase component
MTKRYIITGYLTYSVLLKKENKYMKCCFEGGAVSGLGCRAASYTTNDKNVQELLENSKEFKSGMIKIAEVYGTEPAKVVEAGVIDEVTTLQQARQYLMDNFEVTIEELQTRANVKEVAAKMNITFPNWK